MPFAVVPGERDGLARQVRSLAKDRQSIVFVDTPPNNREILSRAGMVADAVIVPVVPTGLDINRLTPTLELLHDLEASKGQLAVGILLTRWDERKILGREAIEALRGFPLMKAKIRGLERYAQSFGQVPTYLDEYKPAWKELQS